MLSIRYQIVERFISLSRAKRMPAGQRGRAFLPDGHENGKKTGEHRYFVLTKKMRGPKKRFCICMAAIVGKAK